MWRSVSVACAFLSFSISEPSAGTVTFTGIPKFGESNQWLESGILGTVSSALNGFGYHTTPGTLHMDDHGAPYPGFVSFEIPGRDFNAVSFDILPSRNSMVLVNNETHTFTSVPFDNIRVRGFRDSVLVAEDAFFMGTKPWTYQFGTGFGALDKLIIYASLYTLPSNPPPGYSYMCDSPCAHFNIDNVTLNPAPVPLPAALPLFATVLAGGGLIAWRRKRKAAKLATS